MVCTILLCGILLAGRYDDAPPGSDTSDLSETEQERLQDALQENLEAWEAGQDVDSFAVTVLPTWYDPALGGQNCNGDCEHIGASANGVHVEDWYEKGAACPSEIPRLTQITLQPRFYDEPITVTCVDGGGSIVIQDDGTIRIDLLRKEPVWTTKYRATMTLPRHEPAYSPTEPRFQPICMDLECARPVVVPNFPTRPPMLICPIGECEEIRGLDLTADHWGVDLRTGNDAEIFSPAWGTVVLNEPHYNGGCGDALILDLGNGWWMRFCHLQSELEPGEAVVPGELLGMTDGSGEQTGQHLHLELWEGWQVKDPLALMVPIRSWQGYWQ